MKKVMFNINRHLAGLFFVLAILNSHANAQEVHEISRDQAVDYALTHNPTILNTALDVESAEAFVKENISSGLPQVSASIDLSDNFELPTTFLPAEVLGGTPGEEIPVQFGTNYSGNATVGLTQMVFDGVFFIGLEAARTFEQLSKKDHIKSKIDLAETVTTAYYNVLVNQLTLQLVEKNYGRLDTLLRETEIMYKNGFAEKIDVNRVKVQFNNIRVNRDNSRKMLDIAEKLLKFQMGMAVDDSVVLTDNLNNEIFDENFSEDFSYSNRIEYSILETQHKLAQLDIKRTKVEYLPKLDLYANLGALAGTNQFSDVFDISNQWFKFGVVGVRMNIPIFDGMQKSNLIQQKKAKLIQVEHSFDQLKNSIDLELNRAKVSYDNSVDYMHVQEENMNLAEEVYEVTKTKYQQGIGSNIEVINADADFKQAQTNYFTALYDALIAKVAYKKALGTLL